MKYRGYVYPRCFDNYRMWWVWRKLFCPRGWHLWDEVSTPDESYLFCDACGEEVGIHESPNETTKAAMEETIDLREAMTLDELFKELNK